MKKLFLAAFAALLSVSLSAQIYVGGSVTLNSANNQNKVTDVVTKTSSFVLAPHAGYWLSDKMAVGGYLNLAFGAPAYKVNRFGIGITPYVRYTILSFDKLNLVAEGGVNFYTQTDKDTSSDGMGAPGFVKDTDTVIGIYAEPIVTYALNDKITLEAALNLARLGFNSVSTKEVSHTDSPSGNTTVVDNTTTTFNLGATTNDIFGGGWGAVRIGFTYNF